MRQASPHRPPLVTVLGATGFVGSAVTAALARRPVRLRAVARRPVLLAAPPTASVESRCADLTAPGAVADAVADADAVVCLVAAGHSAGWRGEADEDGTGGTTGLLRAVLGALGPGPGGRPPGPPPVVLRASPVMPGAPANGYERDKAAAERIVRDGVREGAVRGGALRLPTVCGPPTSPTAADRGVVTAMARRALEGLPLTLWHDGGVRRDPIDVRDVAAAFVAALGGADELVGGAWDVGGDDPLTVRELFAAVAEHVAEHVGRPLVPVVAVDPPDHAVEADFADVVADSAALRSATGWRPRIGLRDTLTDTVAALVRDPDTRRRPAASGSTAT